MLVRYLVRYLVNFSNGRVGAIKEVSEAEAERMIKAGFAELVKAEVKETATSKRAVTRKTRKKA